jgi:tetratricopeptide (TPR) repeat protein
MDSDTALNNASASLDAANRGEIKNAIKMMKETVQQCPPTEYAHVIFGFLLMMDGRHEDARLEFEKALAIDPEQSGALFGLGLSLHDAGRFEEAEEIARKLVAASQKAHAYRLLGKALGGQKRFGEAIGHLKRATELDEKSPYTPYLLGVYCTFAQNLDMAKTAFQRALEIDTNYVDAYVELGFLEYGLGNNESSAHCLGKAIALDPEWAKPHFYLALTLKAKGEKVEPEAEMRIAMRLCSDAKTRQDWEETFANAASPGQVPPSKNAG